MGRQAGRQMQWSAKPVSAGGGRVGRAAVLTNSPARRAPHPLQAQMVGPLSAAGTMCERMHAVHRWCVTGVCGLGRVKAFSAAGGPPPCSLADPACAAPFLTIQAPPWAPTVTSSPTSTPCCTPCSTIPLAVSLLLPRNWGTSAQAAAASVAPSNPCTTLALALADAVAWRRMISDPLSAGKSPAAARAWQLLSTVLRPLMWRNIKAVVAQEFHLPHRTLKPVWLSFKPGERAFYEQVVEQARTARAELDSFRLAQEDGPEDDDGTLASPAARRTAKRRAAKLEERLETAAADNLTQLRQACIHPQVRQAAWGLPVRPGTAACPLQLAHAAAAAALKPARLTPPHTRTAADQELAGHGCGGAAGDWHHTEHGGNHAAAGGPSAV